MYPLSYRFILFLVQLHDSGVLRFCFGCCSYHSLLYPKCLIPSGSPIHLWLVHLAPSVGCRYFGVRDSRLLIPHPCARQREYAGDEASSTSQGRPSRMSAQPRALSLPTATTITQGTTRALYTALPTIPALPATGDGTAVDQ